MSEDDFSFDDCPFPGNFGNLLKFASESEWITETAGLIGKLQLQTWSGTLVHATSEERWLMIARDGKFEPHENSHSSLGLSAYFFSGSDRAEVARALEIAEPYYMDNPRWPGENGIVVSGYCELEDILDLRGDDGSAIISTFRSQVIRLQKSFEQCQTLQAWEKILPSEVFDCAIWKTFSTMFPQLKGFLTDMSTNQGRLKGQQFQTFASIGPVESSHFTVHSQFSLKREV